MNTQRSATRGIDALAEVAISSVGGRRRALLGIAGAPGAGKSTLAEALLAAVEDSQGAGWAAHLPMDGFHLADAQLDRLGARDRKGAPDTFDAAGYAHTLARVAATSEEPIYVPGFERTLEQPLAAALVIPPEARLVVTEGNYLLLDQEPWTTAREQLDEVWFVTVDPDVRRTRLIDRHVAFGKDPETARAWALSSDEANARLVETTARRADRVVTNGPEGWSFG